MIIGMVMFAFMRALGELLLSNTRFNSFVDIANEYIGPFAGFVIGWTYWLAWIASSMSDLTQWDNILVLVPTSSTLDYRLVHSINVNLF